MTHDGERMPFSLPRPQPRALVAAASAHAREAAEIVYAARLRPPAGAGRIVRLACGLGLPLAILHALLGDPVARRRYLRTCAAQAAIIFTVGALFVAGNAGDLVELFSWKERVVVTVGEDGGRRTPDGVTTADGDSDVPEPDERRADGAGAPSSFVDKGLAFWSALYGALCAAQWIVVALSREHHDAIGADAARLTCVPPEDAPARPRIRLNFAWIRKTARRKAHGALLFAAGAFGLGVLAPIPVVGPGLYAAGTTLWGAYWLAVFVGAKSMQAWKYEHTAPPPSFLARWERLTERTPGFRFWLPRLYGKLLRRLSARFFSPAYRFERCPYELAGLTLARVLCFLPGAYMFLRPLVPVAAAHVFVGDEERLREVAAAGAEAPADVPRSA
jgi:hypothetical protein